MRITYNFPRLRKKKIQQTRNITHEILMQIFILPLLKKNYWKFSPDRDSQQYFYGHEWFPSVLHSPRHEDHILLVACWAGLENWCLVRFCPPNPVWLIYYYLQFYQIGKENVPSFQCAVGNIVCLTYEPFVWLLCVHGTYCSLAFTW